MKVSFFVVAVIAIFCFADSAYSQTTRCQQIKDPARRRFCLENELARATVLQQQAARKLEQLNLVMHRACQTYEVLDHAADLAVAQGATRNIQAAGATWITLRSLLSAVTREKRKCDSARAAVERARRR